MRLRISELICIALILGGLVLAMQPNTRGEVNHLLPAAMVKWINDDHDEEENLLAFSILGIFALCFGRHSESGTAGAGSVAARWFRSRAARMAALMVLVCVIELVQNCIPGRVADMDDVCTGWSGIFAAWLLSVLLDARVKNSADVKSLPD